jgi:hypothetical protein
MGWRWVLYWPAIGCGFGAIILFFLMEETNYDRKTIGIVEAAESSSSSIEASTDPEKGAGVPRQAAVDTSSDTIYHKKTYLQKLSLMDKPRPNKLLMMIRRPFTFVTLPVVLYCGFA